MKALRLKQDSLPSRRQAESPERRGKRCANTAKDLGNYGF